MKDRPLREWTGRDGLRRRREPSGRVFVLRGMIWREQPKQPVAGAKVVNIQEMRKR